MKAALLITTNQRAVVSAAFVVLLFCSSTSCYQLRSAINEDSVERFADSSPKFRVVKCEQELLTILTPVFPDWHTLSLLRNQLRTFATFADIGSFAAWLLVTPASSAETLTEFLDAELRTLPRALDELIAVVHDEVCAPELEARRFEDLVFEHAPYVSGWLKQQVLKLACGHLIETPYYLITDADTFFLNPFGSRDVVEVGACDRDGDIVCDTTRTQSYRAKLDLHSYVNGTLPTGKAQWIYNTASTLQLSMPEEHVNESIGVTPQTMSTAVVAALAAHIGVLLKAEVWETVTWRAYLILAIADYFSLPKHEQLEGNTPWTEYNAYWLYALQTGLWNRYHVRGELQSVDANAWTSQAFTDWDPCAVTATDETNLRLWGTVQSVVVVKGEPVSGDAVWAKLRHCVPEWQGMTPAVKTTRHGCIPT